MALEREINARPKVLLVTGTPPGTHGVGEIVLRDLVLHYGPNHIRCSAVVAPHYVSRPDERLAELPVQMLSSTHTRARRWGNGKWGAAGSLWNYLVGFRREVRRLTGWIANQVQASEVDQVFVVLNSPLMFALAHRIARRLRRPLVTLVWDPPDYLLTRAKFDRLSRRMLFMDFRRSLAASRRVAVVSETMQEDYARLTSAPIRILRHGVSMDFEKGSGSRLDKIGDEWVIGFSGTMYADCAWQALLNALDQANWRIAGRRVRLRVLAPHISMQSRSSARIEYLGYRSVEEMLDVLRQCHLTYLPQPFASHFKDSNRYSFPTKLTTYASIGLPVFVHCPADSALSRFFDAYPIGARSTSLEAAPIISALESLLGDQQVYQDACRQVMKVACSHFDASVFCDGIDWLLQRDTGKVSDDVELR
jgi:hypothetical protein